ncbi:Centromere protein H [Lasallia pustulata]|uniref:Centromere protein H n=1 Tax=Lasallia pustulata TaxID=136370 RepID=A0A1W5DD09_9LECA|nr:Centromere protein H [Lasallia pustulata]
MRDVCHFDRVPNDLVTEDATISNDNLADQLKRAERGYLESRSAYLLKSSIWESILVTDPTLKAVHSGANATPAERSLHPLIDTRDVLSIAHANLASHLTTMMDDLTMVEAQNIISSKKNRTLADTLLDLTANMQSERAEDVSNAKLRSQLQVLKEETKMSKARWRIMKSVTAAVIVGSGIDWSRNDELRELVLDDEDGPA